MSASLEQLIASDGEFVARILRRAGVLDDSVDDGVQQFFLVAARKLPSVPPESGRAFLVGVALNVAAHARRSSRWPSGGCVLRAAECASQRSPSLILRCKGRSAETPP